MGKLRSLTRRSNGKEYTSDEKQFQYAKQFPTQQKIAAVTVEKMRRWKIFTGSKTQEHYRVYTRWIYKNKNDASSESRATTWNFKCAKTQPKQIWKFFNRKIKLTEAIPALNFSDGTHATTDNDEAELLNNFSSLSIKKRLPEIEMLSNRKFSIFRMIWASIQT